MDMVTSEIETQERDGNGVYYTDANVLLSEKHLGVYNQLKAFRDDVLDKKVEWKLHKFGSDIIDIFSDGKTEYSHIREATDEMYEYLRKYATADILVANITATGYNIKKAKENLLKQIQFRVTFDIDNLTPEMAKEGIQLGVIQCKNTVTKKGQPIVYFKTLSRFPKKYYKPILLSYIYAMEKARKIAKANGGSQSLWIFDCSELSVFHIPMALAITIPKLEQFWPNETYKAYVIHAPMTIQICWNIVSAFMNENQKNKFNFPKQIEPGYYGCFKDIIDRNQFDAEYGGLAVSNYSFKEEMDQWNKQ